jgi:hypothetical protein
VSRSLALSETGSESLFPLRALLEDQGQAQGQAQKTSAESSNPLRVHYAWFREVLSVQLALVQKHLRFVFSMSVSFISRRAASVDGLGAARLPVWAAVRFLSLCFLWAPRTVG